MIPEWLFDELVDGRRSLNDLEARLAGWGALLDGAEVLDPEAPEVAKGLRFARGWANRPRSAREWDEAIERSAGDDVQPFVECWATDAHAEHHAPHPATGRIVCQSCHPYKAAT